MAACCEEKENLGEPQATDRPDLVVRVCSVCGRRHFELNAEPGKFGIELQSLRGA